ncbi:MAG: hypothetical protein PHP02_06370 [Eubacteriales bacterium]|nr:hypothetical protein [Eubacteriales bacterium]
MNRYHELVSRYENRNRAMLVDGVSTALSHVDEVVTDLGLLEETGLLPDVLGTVSLGLPFVIIAITEQGAVIRGRKTSKAAIQDATFRALKTGAGLAAGGAVMASGLGALPAIPVAVGVRAMLDKYRSSLLTSQRVRQRTQRLKALSASLNERALPQAMGGQEMQAITP